MKWIQDAIKNKDEKALIIAEAKLMNDLDIASLEKDQDKYWLTLKAASKVLKEIKSPGKNQIKSK